MFKITLVFTKNIEITKALVTNSKMRIGRMMLETNGDMHSTDFYTNLCGWKGDPAFF